jgi:hypothetical protein
MFLLFSTVCIMVGKVQYYTEQQLSGRNIATTNKTRFILTRFVFFYNKVTWVAAFSLAEIISSKDTLKSRRLFFVMSNFLEQQ